jgi:hypothetical protein
MKRAHHDLKVWQESMDLIKMIYEISTKIKDTLKIQNKFWIKLTKSSASLAA